MQVFGQACAITIGIVSFRYFQNQTITLLDFSKELSKQAKLYKTNEEDIEDEVRPQSLSIPIEIPSQYLWSVL